MKFSGADSPVPILQSKDTRNAQWRRGLQRVSDSNAFSNASMM